MNSTAITNTILAFYPNIEAIYLFGTYQTEDEWPESDVDIALLFPPGPAKLIRDLPFGDCCIVLTDVLKKDIDLVNLRIVHTVLQHEIIQTGRIIYMKDEYTIDLFEMIVMSLYQKLNEERAGILKEIYQSGRILNV